MARTKETWTGIFDGPPELIGRAIHFKVKLADDPNRPVVVIMPLSRGKRFIQAFSRVLARGQGTKAFFDSPDFKQLDEELAD